MAQLNLNLFDQGRVEAKGPYDSYLSRHTKNPIRPVFALVYKIFRTDDLAKIAKRVMTGIDSREVILYLGNYLLLDQLCVLITSDHLLRNS